MTQLYFLKNRGKKVLKLLFCKNKRYETTIIYDKEISFEMDIEPKFFNKK